MDIKQIKSVKSLWRLVPCRSFSREHMPLEPDFHFFQMLSIVISLEMNVGQ